MSHGQSAAYAAKLRALLPFIDAHALGEQIEHQVRPGVWVPMPNPHWGDDYTNYRVKPNPRTFYVLRYSDKSCYLFDSAKARDDYVAKYGYQPFDAEAITAIEQLESQ